MGKKERREEGNSNEGNEVTAKRFSFVVKFYLRLFDCIFLLFSLDRFRREQRIEESYVDSLPGSHPKGTECSIALQLRGLRHSALQREVVSRNL